ncbi:MAG: LytR C-terminal domain-containing protein [Kiloniellales bacterium]
MTTPAKIFASTVALLGPLVLAGCGALAPEMRPVFGNNDMAVSDGPGAYELARSDFEAQRYGLAVKHFQRAIAEAPQSVEALNGLAATYDQLGRFALSERLYRRALAADPGSTQTLNNLGYSLILQGKHDLARVFLTDAARSDTANQIVASNLDLADGALEAARPEPTAVAASSKTADIAPAPEAALETVLQLGPGVIAWKEPRIVRTSAQVQELQVGEQPSAAEQALSGDDAAELVPVAFTPFAAREMPRVSTVGVSVTSIAALLSPAPAITQPASPTPPARRPATIQVVTKATAPTSPDHQIKMHTPQNTLLLPQGTLEVSNGAGRRAMAARMRLHLKDLGLSVSWLSNADHFSHMTTTITYRAGHQALAEAVAKTLPIAIAVRPASDQASDVRLELGGDLLDFDRKLLVAERQVTHDPSI